MRNGAWSSRRHAKKDFLLEIRRACRHEPAVTRKNKAVSGGFSEQDDSASGFAWVAREPQLMYGAKGRASSQRFLEYHIPTPIHSLSTVEVGFTVACLETEPGKIVRTRSCFHLIGRWGNEFDASFHRAVEGCGEVDNAAIGADASAAMRGQVPSFAATRRPIRQRLRGGRPRPAGRGDRGGGSQCPAP